LLDYAKEYALSLEEISFELIAHDTCYKGIVDEDWQYLQDDELLERVTESEIRSEIFLIQQNYTVRFYPFKPHPYLHLKATIVTNKYKTKIILSIDPSSTIPLKKGVQEWIKEVIRDKQLRNGFLIDLFDRNLDREIHKLLYKLQKEGELKKPYRLVIGEFFSPMFPTNDKVILHYKENKTSNSLIEGVHPGDLIFEYLFPKYGRDGRSCDGEFIKVPEPKIKYADYIVINDDTIYSEEDSESIRFYAGVSGFVKKRKGIFSISQELHLDGADFKKTGSIETGIDKDVSLKINKKSSNEDAIGIGVNIDVQKLDVGGIVGSNTKIQACEINIGAQTHRKSQINVTEMATIHLHRGNLKAKKAHIDILESGKVEADEVHIHKMVGGEVRAKNVYIDILYSNARIIALESITIGQIEGNGNNLIIDPNKIESYHQHISDLKRKIKDKNSRLQLQTKEFVLKKSSVKEKSARITLINERIQKAKEHRLQPLRADMIRIQQYKADVEQFRALQKNLQESEHYINTLKITLENLYTAHLHAKIIHDGIYNGQNRITFIDPKTLKEYGNSPEGIVKKIALRIDNDVIKFEFST